MSKNVLVITGSPRKNGNSSLLADAFIQGARESGHRVETFAAAENKIRGCTACDNCWSAGAACVIPDDFQQLAPLLEKAEVLVFAYPLYWSTMPAQLKNVVDRLYAYLSPSKKLELPIKKSYLLLCGECAGDAIFDITLGVHQGIADFFHWEDGGVVKVPEVLHPGEVEATGALEKARELGRTL